MTIISTRIRVAPDGTISGRAPAGVPAGEHEAEIVLRNQPVTATVRAETLAAIRAIQDELAQLPVLDLGRRTRSSDMTSAAQPRHPIAVADAPEADIQTCREPAEIGLSGFE